MNRVATRPPKLCTTPMRAVFEPNSQCMGNSVPLRAKLTHDYCPRHHNQGDPTVHAKFANQYARIARDEAKADAPVRLKPLEGQIGRNLERDI